MAVHHQAEYSTFLVLQAREGDPAWRIESEEAKAEREANNAGTSHASSGSGSDCFHLPHTAQPPQQLPAGNPSESAGVPPSGVVLSLCGIKSVETIS